MTDLLKVNQCNPVNRRWFDIIGKPFVDESRTGHGQLRYGCYYHDENGDVVHDWFAESELREKPAELRKCRATLEVDLLTNGRIVVRRATHENCISDAGPFFVETREVVIEWEVPHEG